MLTNTLVAVVVTALYEHFEPEHPAVLTLVPFSLIGLALGIFLGFRNNTSYDRFWEGRKLWGRFVNTSRTLARQITTLIHSQEEAQEAEVTALHRELVYVLIAYIHGARLHLREQTQERGAQELAPFLPPERLEALLSSSNAPIALLASLGHSFQQAWRRGWVHTLHLPVLESSLTALTDIQGGCERIKKTPIPFSYTVLIHRIVGVYCLTLPFGIVDQVGYLTPLVVLMISYTFLGLDAIGDEIEDPFGEDLNDLPLSALSRMIEVNLRETLGETDLPPMLQPDENNILS
jgi:putative membrane protein